MGTRGWFRRTGRLGALAGVAVFGSTTACSMGSGGGAPAPEASLAVGFVKGTVTDAELDNVTTLDFGPDGRLYVGLVYGVIRVYDITRDGPGDYRITGAETITAIQDIANHDDDGAENIEEVTRQVTGLLAAGTAEAPVVYVTSSDPRQGGGPKGTDTGLDTNSGVVSRLTRDPAGGPWARLDLIRGLPRSEENHAPNGLALSADGRTLFVAQGGMTNQGAPSKEFAYLPEYALSAAILRIDLAAVGETTYDLPTLDDPTRRAPASGAAPPAGFEDDGDPFGGNDGRNQALLRPGGPVGVHAPGFRNPYDLVLARDGRMWTVDNGANPGWGDIPGRDGPGGRCTNRPREGGAARRDVLHLVSGPGYYGGHPNPTRGNGENRFGDQSPVSASNPVECTAGADLGKRATFPASTNGLVEYRSSAPGRELAGDLLTVGFDNRLYRVEVGGEGKGAPRASVLFADVGTAPLDVTAQGDGERFPGTIWVGDYATGVLTVYDPRRPSSVH